MLVFTLTKTKRFTFELDGIGKVYLSWEHGNWHIAFDVPKQINIRKIQVRKEAE